MQLLIEEKANLNSKSTAGYTPLLYALQREHEAAASYLVRVGAELPPKDADQDLHAIAQHYSISSELLHAMYKER
jgi:ankyrin repeat protein